MKHVMVRALLIGILLALFTWNPQPMLAAGANHAGLVVVLGPNQVFSTCVSFDETELTGAELLSRAGLRVVVSSAAGFGTTVCKINDIGCNFPAEQCFCQCLGSPCTYWNYWYWQDGGWVYSGRGAGARKVHNGDLDAWVWGDGNTAPPTISPESLCALAAPTAAQLAPTLAPTLPATAASTATAIPSPTPEAKATLPSATMTPSPPAAASLQNIASATMTALPSATATPPPTQAPTTAPSLTVPATVAVAETVADTTTLYSSTPTPTPAVQHISLGSYGLFAALLLAMLLLIGYATLLRRRRGR